MFKIILIYVVFWKICVTGEITVCPFEYSTTETNVTVEWQATAREEYQFSKPMCLNEMKIPEHRICNRSSGDWNPSKAPRCVTTQDDYKTISKCPPQFIQLKGSINESTVCVRLSDSTKWNSDCVRYGSGKTIFDLSRTSRVSLSDHLKSANIQKIWIPANRSGLYDPIVWRLPGIWGDYVELDHFDYINIGPRQDPGNCVSVQLGGSVVMGALERCTKRLPMLCIYQEKPLLRLGCGKNAFTTRYHHYQNICFNIVDLVTPTTDSARAYNKCEQNVLFRATSPEKNYIYQILMERMRGHENDSSCNKCAVSVIPEHDGRFSWTIWNMSLPFIKFVGWDHFPGDGNFVANSCDGKWTLTDQVDCVACEQKIQILKPEISLIFKQEWGKLFVTVVNRRFLWREDNNPKKDDDTDKEEYQDDEDYMADDDDDDEGDKLGIYCFTNGGRDILKKIDIGKRIWFGNISPSTYRIDSVKKEIYELEIENDGVYWCEGHAIPDFELVQSKKVVAFSKSTGTLFAALINYHCYLCVTQINNRTFLHEISSNFRTLLQSVPLGQGKLIHSVRLIRIESLNYMRSIIQLLFHIKLAVSDDHEEDSCENDEPDEVGVPDDILEIYFIRKKLWSILKEVEARSVYKVVSLNNTQYCLPENLHNDEVNWISARINEKSVPKELCLQKNGVPVTRKCVGDFNYGGVWEELSSGKCHEDYVSLITQQLYEMGGLKNYTEILSMQAILNISKIVEYSRPDLIPADLFYMGRVLKTISGTDENNTNVHQEVKLQQMTSIISNVMLVNATIIRRSQKLNTTNLILDAYNNIINKMSLSSQSLMEDGTAIVYMPKLIVFVADPSVKNISGVALYKNLTGFHRFPSKTGDFSDYYIKPLYSDHYFQGEKDMFETAGGSNDELEVASFVPEKLIQSLISLNASSTLQGISNSTKVKPPLRIVIALHYNDVLFQENVNVTTEKSGSIIISVSIPGYDTNLRGFLPIYFSYNNMTKNNQSTGNKTNALCGYWDFSPENPDINSEWAKDGCKFQGLINVPNPVKICYCTHLTHFALLVQGHFVNDYDDDNNYILVEMIHNEVLDVITLTGCSLSLVGIFGIYVTALMFRTWREKPNAKVLLQLSTAIALQMILMCLVSSEAVNIKIITGGKFEGCIVFGACLQYSVLVVFSWMLITAYLQFVRYVRVLGNQRPSRFFLKSFLIGWCMPLIPVFLIIIIDPSSYIPPGVHDISRVCYPSGYSLYFGVLLPIALIVIANLIIFILVIFSISRGTDGKLRATDRELTLSQLRLSIFLFFLLGLSWIFGLAVASQMGIVFSYLFCLTATLQGFVLFVYFVLMDPHTRHLWIDRFKKWGWCPNGSPKKTGK